jgi:glycerate kinase
MSLQVLIVPDKFKGTLTARQAAEAIARGWRTGRPGDHLKLLPMSDGGDGFGEVLGDLAGATQQITKTVDAAHRPVEAAWWWAADTRTAIVESARVIGLAMLPRGKYHPFELDTFGLGAVLLDAANRGAARCLIGIGGSATNDAGFGLARALGWQFFNTHEESITRWTELHHLAMVRPPQRASLFEELIVAVDVQNPLLGPEGCSRIYGPQKGLTEFEFAERSLGQLAAVIERQMHVAHANTPGAGAAGGLGFGLACFGEGRFQPGFDIFAECADLEEQIRSAQLTITGEGALDAQTLMGKGVGGIAALCRKLNVRCIGLAGVAPNREQALTQFASVHALVPDLTDKESAMRDPAPWLERLAVKAAREWIG